MPAVHETIPLLPGESFACRRFRVRRFEMPWHLHPECELTLIVKGRGTRFVGDSVERFADGDLVLLGPNLPHYWWSDRDNRCSSESIVAQYNMDFMGTAFLDLPESKVLRRLLAASGRGLHFPASLPTASKLADLVELTDWSKLQLLLEILGELAYRADGRLLASLAYAADPVQQNDNRIVKACRYVQSGYNGEIRQPEAARLVGMTPAAFSRFFRKHMRRTFESYVTEVRIGHACRLLIDTGQTVAETAFAAGFNNLANFNRHFRRLKGTSPREYRLQHATPSAISGD